MFGSISVFIQTLPVWLQSAGAFLQAQLVLNQVCNPGSKMPNLLPLVVALMVGLSSVSAHFKREYKRWRLIAGMVNNLPSMVQTRPVGFGVSSWCSP